ncbi:MAG TPA: hypothetical protein VFW83_02675 [Bryobacteraceae bacterium]|nr:hypothetical protein [Bryobacteraceae bacterium]
MKFAAFLLACSFPSLAQQTTVQPPRPRPINIHFYVQIEPPDGGINGWRTSRSREGNGTVFHIWAYSASGGRYWGCDILFEPQQEDGVYLARFRPLSIKAADVTRNIRASAIGDSSNWNLQPPPAYPAPQRIEIGETIAIDLMNDITSGEKLVAYVQLAPSLGINSIYTELQKMSDSELRAFESQLKGKLQTLNNEAGSVLMTTGPKPAIKSPSPVSGPARAFSSSDAEIQLAAPRVHIGGSTEDLSSPGSVSGALPWFYLPGRGRFILSLVPRSGFLQSGEIEGRALSVKDGKDTIALQSQTFMVSDFGTYFLYIRHDKSWRPEPEKTSEVQLGVLSPRELKKLR